MDDNPYMRSYLGPLSKYLVLGDTNYVLREIHEGACDNHSKMDSLVLKIMRVGYYWPLIEEDAKCFIIKYETF